MVVQIDGKEVVLDEALVTYLSLAVSLVDIYTKDRPVGRVRVIVKELLREGLLNPTGYFLFLNLPDGLYTLRVESEHYLDIEVPLSLPTSPPESPLVTIFLQPRTSYPFPPGATLIRGVVRDPTKNPVSGARIEIVGKNIRSESANNGEFVIYFGALKEADTIKENSKRFIKGNGTKAISIEVNHPIYGNKTLDITEGVEEGKIASVIIEF